MNFAKMIVHQARAREHDPAVAFTGGIATYGMLARAVMSVARRLERASLPEQGVVAVDIRNPFHHLAVVLALELRGVPTAAIQTAFASIQAGFRPAAVLADRLSQHDDSLPVITVEADWFVMDPNAPTDFAGLRAMPGFAGDDTLVRIVFSSGTTGGTKATGFTAAMIEKRICHNMLVMGGGGITGVRLATMMGFSTLPGYILPAMVLSCGGMICLAGNPADLLHLTRALRADMAFTAVGQLAPLVETLGESPPPGLKMLATIGSRLPAALREQVRARLCSNLHFAYGTTETGLISLASTFRPDDPEGAAGYLMPWVDLQVVDGDDQPVADGGEGVIRVRTGDQAPYFGDSPGMAGDAHDGWFYPGDVGRLHVDGAVEVTGRSVEVINRGGSIVAPEVVEQVLEQRPEVRAVAAFGVPGNAGIEEIWAAIVTDEPFDERELIRFCRERLADKAPGAIRRVATIPRTGNGKIMRRQLRDDVVAADLARAEPAGADAV